MQKKRSEESIFAEAISQDSIQSRDKYLDEACHGDRKLKERIERLIAAHEKNASFIAGPENFTATHSVLPKSIAEGETIGRYKLLQQIGEGGFGVVFMAEQVEPVRRRVALKIIKPGMDSKEVIARFEAERQALAMMEHPNIAKVLDAGKTESGHPFFVMELVKGVPITTYADDNQLSTKERLKLFVQICRAIQHAHQKGVIHRDLKPGNIMVTLHDGIPIPKVIDFGVSKALNQQLTEKTLFTRYGQIIGTPQYMSPEQAEISGLDIDTRSDVYSLGVLLYELLTGRPPFDAESLRKAGFDEMRRIIREKEPVRPSDCLLTLDQDTATTVAKCRNVQPGTLSKFVKGELDWIVMRSLEKSRERRFDSAGAFADEIQRHLNGEIVQTSAPSRLYVAWKIFNRHRSLFLTTAVLFIVMASAAVVSFIYYQSAERNLEVAYRARKKAEEAQKELEAANQQLREEQQASQNTLGFLTEFIASSDSEVISKLLKESSSHFGDNPATEYKVLKQITASLIRERELPVLPCERLVDLASSVFGKGSREYSLAILELGNVSYDIEKVKSGIANEKKFGREPSSKMLSVLGMFMVRQQKYTDAIEILEQAIPDYDRTEVAGPYCDIPHLWLSEAYREMGQEEKYQKALSIGVDELISSFPEAKYDNWLSESSYCVSDLRERDLRWPIQPSEWAAMAAFSIHKNTGSNQSLWKAHGRLGQSYRCSGRTRKAIDSYSASIQAAESILLVDKRTWQIGFRLATTGRALRDVGDYQKQEEFLDKALDAVKGSDDPFIKYYLPYELALVKRKLGKNSDFERLAEKTYQSLLPIVSDESQELWGTTGDWYVFMECAFLLEKNVPRGTLSKLIELPSDENVGDNAGLNFAQGFAFAMIDDWDAALLKFEEGMTKGCDYSFAASELSHIENLVLDKMVERNETMRATDLLKALVDFKQQTMPVHHPQIGLSKLRYATFLQKHSAEPAFAKRMLVEAKEQLDDHPMLPTTYLKQIEHLMKQLNKS